MSTVFVLDTSYLMELYAVPGCSSLQMSNEVRAKVATAVRAGHALVLPVGVIYESGNHIANIRDSENRVSHAEKFFEDIQESAKNRQPFLLAPREPQPELLRYLEVFATQSVHRSSRGRGSLGLVDTQIAEIARHWKAKPGYTVHIWTTDSQLKREEPDPEPNSLR